MRNKPTYTLNSVDSALLLVTLLQHEGPTRVTDAAARLGVAVSTAHRLLGMLVYRDFAEQLPDRRYGPGPLLVHGPLNPTWTPSSRLRSAALPHLRRLVAEQGESAHLVVAAGTEVRFVATVECDAVLRVGDRSGRALPAHLVAAGQAMLAQQSAADLDQVLPVLDAGQTDAVRRRLQLVRKRGFAINDQQTEAGLFAVGVAVSTAHGPQAGISLALPRVRYSRDRVPVWHRALAVTAAAIADDLSSSGAPADGADAHQLPHRRKVGP